MWRISFSYSISRNHWREFRYRMRDVYWGFTFPKIPRVAMSNPTRYEKTGDFFIFCFVPMENKVFVHLETGEMKTQINIYEINKYREATDNENLLYHLPYNPATELIQKASKDFGWREWEIIRTLKSITQNYHVPEWYEVYEIQGEAEDFQITKKPSGEISITN